MKMISFANFDNFDKPSNLFPETESDEQTVDFSAILNNISATLQTTDLPVQADAPVCIKGDFSVALEIPANPNPAFDSAQTENKLLELPDGEIKTPFPPKSDSNPELPATPTLWAGMQTTVRQRLNGFKSEIDLEERAKLKAGTLFQAETNPKTDVPTKSFDKIELPINNLSKLQLAKSEKIEDSPVLPQLFQAENAPIRKKEFKFEKPFLNSQPQAPDTKKDYLPTTIPIIQNSAEIPTNDYSINPEFRIKEAANNPSVLPQITVLSSENGDSKTMDFDSFESPKIVLNPRFEGNKLKGFDITPNEVHSILKTFENFFKNPMQPAETVKSPVQQSDVVASGTFQDISKSIRESFESIIKDSDTNPKLKNPYQSPDIWWNGQNNTDKNGKIPTEEIPQNLFGKNETTNESNSFEIVKNQPIEEISLNPKPEFQIKTEQTEQKVNDNDLKTAIKFDNFLPTFSKPQNQVETLTQQDVQPVKVFEQINPHLLELAALTAKKQEKQTLKLRLHPAELGTVEIKLEKNSSGTLNAYFKTENDGARTVLTQNLEQLRDSLQNAGWQVGQMEITNGSNSQTANQHHEQNSRQFNPVENFNFSRNSDKPDDLEQNTSNRLLNLLA